MGRKDLYQSDFYEDGERFADVFNGIFFGGKEVMKAAELKEADSVMVDLANSRQGKKVICDKIRKWKGRYLSIMVLESQSYVDYGMVFRVMESEAIGYMKQKKEKFQEEERRNTKFDSDEFLSKMKKNEKFTPIITLVLYLGKDKIWDGETSLYGILELEEELQPYVNNFKLNLYDYHDHDNFNIFKTENRLLFQMLSCGKDKKKMKHLLQEEREYRQVDEETAKAILGILGYDKPLEKIKQKSENGKEKYDMCQAFDDYREEGRQEGILEGRREGKQEGELIMALKTVKNLMKKQKISCEEAFNILGISRKMREEIISKIDL